MSIKSGKYLLPLIGLWAITASATTIDEAAARNNEPIAKVGGGPIAKPSHVYKIVAIYGLGEKLRTDLLINGELFSGMTVGSTLPNGLHVVKVSPMEVDLAEGKSKTIIRLQFSSSPAITESENSQRQNGSDGRSPSLMMPAGRP